MEKFECECRKGEWLYFEVVLACVDKLDFVTLAWNRCIEQCLDLMPLSAVTWSNLGNTRGAGGFFRELDDKVIPPMTRPPLNHWRYLAPDLAMRACIAKSGAK